jgi:hypothetical protein
VASSVEVLATAALEAVIGGQNSTSVTTPFGSYNSNRTDYAMCRESARRYCDTRPESRTSFIGIDTGVNEAKSAACMRTTLPQMCGTPR